MNPSRGGMIPKAQPKRELLIVEDDFDVRDALVQVLEYEGFAVSSATNGREAIDRLRTAEPPCLILLDLMMPIMDGWQFRTEQLRDPSLASIPVILISADGAIDEKASRLSAAAYLRKPIEIETLLELIGRYC